MEMDRMTALRLALEELLSEYRVDQAGIEAAFDLARDYGEAENQAGWDHGYDSGKAIFE